MRRSLTLAAMSVSQGMILLDVTIVNVGLPAIQRELHAPPDYLEWVISSYALVLATLIPLGGRLGDRFGRKRIFLAGLAVFTIASVGCALAGSAAVLIGFRAFQGVGGAVMSALTLSILSEAYPAERRAGAIGIWAAVGGLGFGLGPVAGGLLLSHFSWSSIFWVNLPIGVLGIVATVTAVGESRDPVERPFDIVGVCLCGAGLFGVALGLIESASAGWSSAAAIGPLVGSVILLAGFVLWERRTSTPMVPAALWLARGFPRASTVYLLLYASQAGMMFYITLFFQDVKDWSALRTGLSWLVMNIPFFVMAQRVGKMSRRWPPQMLIGSGCLVAGVASLGLSQITTGTSFTLVALWYVLYGIGCGVAIPLIATAAMSNVPPGASGVASGILNASRQVGTSIGLAVLGSVGVSTATSAWHSKIASLPNDTIARSLTHDVTGGQLEPVRQRLGASGARLAVPSFVHGFTIAVGISAVILLVAATVAYSGLRTSRADKNAGERAQAMAADAEQAVGDGESPTHASSPSPSRRR